MMSAATVALLLAVLIVTADPAPAPAEHYFTDAPLHALESKLLADVADGKLDEHELAEAAMIAGGEHSPRELAAQRDRWERLVAALQRHIEPHPPLARREELIHRFLHREVLTGEYRVSCDSLYETLSAGHYNCVTATLLFAAMCQRCGFTVTIMAAPRHVFCRIDGASPRDVEPTCANWFDAHDPTRRAALAARYSAQETADMLEIPHEISPVQLIARVYYNRGVAWLQQRQFEAAVTALQVSLRLDARQPPARDNLLAAFNNWALEACDAGHYSQAAELLARARRVEPDYGPLQSNDVYVHRQWIMQLCEQGEFAQASALLDAAYARRPDVPLFDTGRRTVYVAWSRSLVQAAKPHAAAVVVQRGLVLFPDCPRLKQLQHDLTGSES